MQGQKPPYIFISQESVNFGLREEAGEKKQYIDYMAISLQKG
jgi:hypothetical protein